MTTTKVRSYNDFDVGLFDREIAVMTSQRGILRWTRTLVAIMLTVIVLAILAGVLTPWAMMISFAAMGYGLWASGKAVIGLNDMISKIEQKRAVAVHLNRFVLKCSPKLNSNALTRWLDINAPGSSFALTESYLDKDDVIISFPDEDTRILFRLTHL